MEDKPTTDKQRMSQREAVHVEMNEGLLRELVRCTQHILNSPKQLALVLEKMGASPELVSNGHIRRCLQDICSRQDDLKVYTDSYTQRKMTFSDLKATYRECIRRLLLESLSIPFEADYVYSSIEHPPLAVPDSTREWFQSYRSEYFLRWPKFCQPQPAAVTCDTPAETLKENTMIQAQALLKAPKLASEQVTYVDGVPMPSSREVQLHMILEANKTIQQLEAVSTELGGDRPDWLDKELQLRKDNLTKFVKLTEQTK